MARIAAELAAGARVAAALAERLSGAAIAVTHHEERIALRAGGSASAVVVTQSDWQAATTEWSTRSAQLEQSGLVADQAGLQALMASAITYRLACTISEPGQAGLEEVVRPQALVSLAWAQTSGTDGRHEPWRYRGFIECSHGSALSVCIADEDELQLATRALAVHAWPPAVPVAADASEVCAELQRWGLAAVPAGSPASPECISNRSRTNQAAPEAEVAGLTPSRGSRSNLRVLVAGNLVAGPFAAVLLVAAGAEVLHIHHPCRPPLRFAGYQPAPTEELDFATRPGRVRFEALLESTDALVENLRPRVLANLGPLAALGEIGSHISLPGFATGSARANWRTLGFQIESLIECGVRRLPGTTEISVATPLVSDYCAAFAGAAAALLRAPSLELPQSSLLRELAAHATPEPRGKTDVR
jgi:hypothetical protein